MADIKLLIEFKAPVGVQCREFRAEGRAYDLLANQPRTLTSVHCSDGVLDLAVSAVGIGTADWELVVTINDKQKTSITGRLHHGYSQESNSYVLT